ncbi:MAG: antibiotic acetyltransferase [Chitinivibrionales bacterium]|nr:antibiotic acetyltransferase [Chitinivibrionales bacterium]
MDASERRTERQGREAFLAGRVLAALYGCASRSLRMAIHALVYKLEGGPIHSRTIRAIFSRYYGVHVGLYSASGCFIPNHFRGGTTIGRYCSIYDTARAFSANHPMNLRSSHALFANPALGVVSDNLIRRNGLAIGNDVFIGHNAILLPPVERVGDGAVIGAGAVVNRDVPPYAVVVGNPARVVRFRFRREIIEDLLKQQWWRSSIEELTGSVPEFTTPLDGSGRVR